MVENTPHCAGIRETIEMFEATGDTQAAEALRASLRNCYEVVPLPHGSTGETQDQQALNAAMLKAPSLLIKGVNFGKAWAWNAFHGFARSSEALIKKRLAVCQACPSFEDSHCKLCGCRCELKNHLMNKLAMKTAECPLKKW